MYEASETKTYRFGLLVVRHEISDFESGFHHRLVIGAIAGEWAGFSFPATMAIDRRLFCAVVDRRAVFPACFEVIEGELDHG